MKNQLFKCLLAALLSATGLLATFTLAGASTPTASASIGYDVSYPQCGGVLPTSAGFGIVGVSDGYPLSTNPCLAGELQWAQSTVSGAPAFYMNTGSPGPAYSSHWPLGQQSPQVCDGTNSPACSYDYGWNNALASFNNAVSAESTNGSTSPTSAAKVANWWLDVETANSWETLEPNYGPTAASDAIDQAALEGSIAYFSSIGVSSLGIYSTASQWTTITGGTGSTFAAVPVWLPGYATLSAAESACLTASFTGGRVSMIQYPSNGLDGDYLCGLVSAPAVGSVTTAGSASFTDQLVASGNNGTVTYVQTSGSPDLNVTAGGLVKTNGALVAGTYSAAGTTSDPNGDSGTFVFTLSVGVITQSGPTSDSVTPAGSASFTDQLVASGNDGTVTYVQTSGSPALSVTPGGLVAINGALVAGTYSAAGTTSDPNGDSGTFVFSLTVTPSVTQSGPTSDSVTTAGSASFTDQLVASGNNGTVTYVQTSGSPDLNVTAGGLVKTNGALVAGTYSAAGTTSDPNGDSGTFVFTLTVTVPIAAVPRATKVIGHAVAGRTVVLAIAGSGFYGRPRVTSHAGTKVLVTKDTGRLLTVRVSVKRGSRNGIFTFRVTFAKGQSLHVKYVQR